jgi:hypothetical protein
MSETCTGEVHNTGAIHDLLMLAVTQRATKQLENGFGLVRDIQTRTTRATINTRVRAATLQENISSTWTYQFSQV